MSRPALWASGPGDSPSWSRAAIAATATAATITIRLILVRTLLEAVGIGIEPSCKFELTVFFIGDGTPDLIEVRSEVRNDDRETWDNKTRCLDSRVMLMV